LVVVRQLCKYFGTKLSRTILLNPSPISLKLGHIMCGKIEEDKKKNAKNMKKDNTAMRRKIQQVPKTIFRVPIRSDPLLIRLPDTDPFLLSIRILSIGNILIRCEGLLSLAKNTPTNI
jgi:hypothetical protein